MALKDLLKLSELDANNKKKIGISEERIEPLKPFLRSYFSFWREYPDLFIDFMSKGNDPDKETPFNLYFFQRVFLRVSMRYKYVYAVYPRACNNAPVRKYFISSDKLL